MECIYLDNSATTKPCEKAVQKALEMMTNKYGNPSSLHSIGLDAELEIENARDIIAASMSVRPDDIYFTSGGTEANNLAILGTYEKRKRYGNRIITTKIEHSSVLECAKELERLGCDVVYLSVDENGHISLEELKEAVNEDTVLVSIMAVNNEMGAIQDLEAIGKLIKSMNSDTLFHSDCVQAYGKIRLTPEKWNLDMLSVSSHKIHGIKNTGALYIKNKSRIHPRFFGGEQQKKVRPGTEISALIPSFGAAVNEFSIDSTFNHVKELRDYTEKKLSDLDNIVINSSDDSLPYILNISVKGIKSETLLHYLESKSIFVSSGSACAKGKKSHVLTALGLDSNLTDSALRISFSKYNTKNDIDILTDAISQGQERLSKAR